MPIYSSLLPYFVFYCLISLRDPMIGPFDISPTKNLELFCFSRPLFSASSSIPPSSPILIFISFLFDLG